MGFGFFSNILRILRRKRALTDGTSGDALYDRDFLERERVRLNNAYLYGINIFGVGSEYVFAGRLDFCTLGTCYGRYVYLDFSADNGDGDMYVKIEEAVETWRLNLIRYGHDIKNYLLLKMLNGYYETGRAFWEKDKLRESGMTEDEAVGILVSARSSVEENLALYERYGFGADGVSINVVRFFREKAVFFDINKLLASMKITHIRIGDYGLVMRFSCARRGFNDEVILEIDNALTPKRFYELNC